MLASRQLAERDGLTKKSLDVICGLQEGDGGILATCRDDAYPFVYPRDASFMTMAMNMHGLSGRSMEFYRYVTKVRRPYGEILQRYHRGRPYVTQKGEADVSPIVIQGIYDTYRVSGDLRFLEEMWGLISESAGSVIANVDGEAKLLHTIRSVHENQVLEEGFEIWANSAAVRGLLDASQMAMLLKHQEPAEMWLAQARALWGRIVERLYDKESGLFIKNLRKDGTRVNSPDVSQVAPFYFGLCGDRETLSRTLEFLKQTLWNETVGGFNRFKDFDLVTDWHWYTGGTGASWPLFTLWMAKFYRRLGRDGAAEECLRFVQKASTDVMDIPEKVAPLKGYAEWKNNEVEYNERIQLGMEKAERSKVSIPDYVPWACPLGWSHAEYLMLDRDDHSAEVRELLGDFALSKPVERNQPKSA